MWLPSPIYERIPPFWLLLGLMFFAFGLYLGFDYQLIFGYLAVGAGCILRSGWILMVRNRHRSKTTPTAAPQPAQSAEDASVASS